MKDNILKIKNEIDSLLLKKDSIIIAIDGNCAAGKSTLAACLGKEYGANVFHMDDFFLTEDMRTEQRLSEVGGNVDYERFLNEVLVPLSEGREVCYVRYDCHKQGFDEPVHIPHGRVSIVEGAYSMHPELIDRYDLKLMIKISPGLQSERIIKRNGVQMHKRFAGEWIPKENEYFECFDIEKKCNIVICAENLQEDER